MARDATKWATELFHQDGSFSTSGKTFRGHEAMIDAANHLFSLFTSIKYEVHKFNSISEGHFSLQIIYLSFEFYHVDFFSRSDSYRGHRDIHSK